MASDSRNPPAYSKENRRARKPVETSSGSEEEEVPSSHPAFRPRVKKSKNPASYPSESLFQPGERVYVCDIVNGNEVFTGPFLIIKSMGDEKYHLGNPTTKQVVKDNVPGDKLRDQTE